MTPQRPDTMPEKGKFLAYNKKRETWFQVFRNVGDHFYPVTEPRTGLSFTPSAWMPLPDMTNWGE